MVNSSPYAPIPPSNQNQNQHASPLSAIQRETKSIALKVREDVWADDSELHHERDGAYKDLLDHAQPRARLEDLVRVYGVQSGVICLGSSGDVLEGNGSVHVQARTSNDTLEPRLFPPSSTYYTPTAPLLSTAHSHSPDASTSTHLTNKPSSAPTTKSVSNLFLSFFKSRQKPSASPSPSSPSSTESSPFPSSTHPSHPEPQTKTTPIPMSKLTITLTPRSASLILADSTSRRTIVSTPRTRDEDLESVARRLVGQLGGWGVGGGGGSVAWCRCMIRDERLLRVWRRWGAACSETGRLIGVLRDENCVYRYDEPLESVARRPVGAG
ncbi:hypothetical protein H2248_002447 [Termitomyces sp. 'cryptogamus']|nr:hypothetical protein H2248_002447 [Termitomyces sp. 'cryptogamus']